jgi:hypothetical protein
MVKHNPPVATGSRVDQFQATTQGVLDEFMHGDITQAEALGRFERGAARLVDGLREQFLVRLHNLEAFRTPRGAWNNDQAGR